MRDTIAELRLRLCLVFHWAKAATDWAQTTFGAVSWALGTLGAAAVASRLWSALKDEIAGQTLGAKALLVFGVAFIALLVLIPIIQLVLYYVGKKRRFLEGYDNRTSLNKKYGRISDQVRSIHDEAWVAWLTGGSASGQGAFDKPKRSNPPKITRVITYAPSNPAIAEFAAMFSDHDAESLRNQIMRTTRDALAAGACVHWVYEAIPMSSMWIVDPDRTTGWVSVEVFAPAVREYQRPTVIIRRFKHEGLFQNMRDSFGYLWDRGTPPPEEHGRCQRLNPARCGCKPIEEQSPQ